MVVNATALVNLLIALMTESDMSMMGMMIVAAKTVGRGGGRLEGSALTKLANSRDGGDYHVRN